MFFLVWRSDDVDGLFIVDPAVEECHVHVMQAEELLLSCDSVQICACKYHSECHCFQWWDIDEL